jgi:NADH dehydrogenase
MMLITGASGFVGRHAVQRLAGNRPGQVRAMVRDASRYTAPPGAEAVEADLTRPDTLPAVLDGVEVVVHCAAITANFKEPYRGAYEDINHRGTEHLMTAASGAGVRRVVLISGLGTKPGPDGTYMATRWGMEEAVRGSGIPHVILQPSVQFGDGAEFVAALERLVRRSPVVPLLGGGGLLFQPIWVEDVVTCIEKSTEDDALVGRAIAIGGSEKLTFKEVMQAICAALGKKRVMAPLPLSIARVQARLMQVLPRPPLTPASMELFGYDNITDIDAVDKNFGFHPRAFREHLNNFGVQS